MSSNPFRRVRQLARASNTAPIYIYGVLLAVLVPLLIIDLGLVVESISGERSAELTPQDWVIEPIVNLPNWPQTRGKAILWLVGAGMGLSAFVALVWWLQLRAIQKAAIDVEVRLKYDIHSQAFRLGGNEPVGLTRSRPEVLFTDRVEQIRVGVAHWFRAIPRSIATLITLLVVACLINTLQTFLFVLLAVGVWRFFVWRKERVDERLRSWRDRANHRLDIMLEDLRMTPLASAHSLDSTPGQPFDEHLRHYRDAALQLGFSRTTMASSMMLVGLLAGGVMLFVAGLATTTTVWGAATLAVALCCAWFPAQRLYRLKRVVASLKKPCEEVLAYLDRDPDVVQIASAQPLDPVKKVVQLDKLTMADHAGQKLLDQLTLSIPAMANIGVLATDDRAPMALAGLFVRYYDPAAGRILYDTHDIRNVTLRSLRKQAAFVAREGLLFTGAVADNIRCGNEQYSTTSVTEAAKIASADEFISQLPQGYSTVVGEQGRPLNKSEAFRIALARAVIRNPSLLIIEEPETPGDGEVIDTALRNVSANRTLIILPNRLNTLRLLDQVILIHQGRIHAQGKHLELLQNNELYRHLIYLRFNVHQGEVS